MFKDMVLILEVAEVFKNANAEGEKWEKNNPKTPIEEKDAQNPDQTQGEQHSGDATMDNSQGEQPPTQKISNVEQAPSTPEYGNKENALVIHASVEKSSEPNATIMTIAQYTEHFSKTTTSIFSPTLPREPTPPRYESKGKGILKEMKRLVDLKAEKEKSEQSLKKILNPATIRARAQKMVDYKVNSSKEATMRITRGNDPLNLTVYERFRLKTLGFTERLEVHALMSKTKSKSNDLLLQSLRAKFQWVLSQAKALGIPPPPELSTFGVSINDKKRKRSTKILKEEEIHLAATAQLTRLQNAIQIGSPEVEEMFATLELTIEARNDVTKARKIVKDNLDSLG
ncbi:hypothetical protein Tco_0924729 [Tanacetum coccineum]|uniref:Uncharacterized protein n=1 Tax=Tanacetum coccineum TaxID=301880 RepID=A0ABQ5D4S4_9ASTR